MRTKDYLPVDDFLTTKTFLDYEPDRKKTLCTYCVLRMNCEILNSDRALRNTFSIQTLIVECPRMIEDMNVEE